MCSIFHVVVPDTLVFLKSFPSRLSSSFSSSSMKLLQPTPKYHPWSSWSISFHIILFRFTVYYPRYIYTRIYIYIKYIRCSFMYFFLLSNRSLLQVRLLILDILVCQVVVQTLYWIKTQKPKVKIHIKFNMWLQTSDHLV